MQVLCTIIIPHYNQWAELKNCLDALYAQSVDLSIVEIIVVDNGTANIDEYWNTLPIRDNLILIKNDAEPNPYTSRNLAIQKSKGALLAFLDAGCRPQKDWLKNGIEYYRQGKTTIAGRFELIYPSDDLEDKVHGLLYLNNQKNVKRSFGVPAGNLFVSADIFVKTGLFNDKHISGNDIEWSLRLLAHRDTIHYADNCVCEYHSPSFDRLLVKVQKYASGTRYLLFQEKKMTEFICKTLLNFLPMRISNFNEALRYRNLEYLGFWDKVTLWLLVWKVKRHYGVALFRRSSSPV